MKVELYAIPKELPRGAAAARHVIVIDVLRASSTIVEALDNGVAAIVPVETLDQARRAAERAGAAGVLLAGERGGLRPDGFDLGNSPFDYRPDVVRGKTIVFTTSNGTRAIARSAGALQVRIGCFANLTAVAEGVLAERPSTVAIVCSGSGGRLCLEDLLCGGKIVERILGLGASAATLDDGARVAHRIAAGVDDVARAIRDSEHGRRLAGLGFEDDLDLCARVDRSTTVPLVADGMIRA